jgi:hypothetical protein
MRYGLLLGAVIVFGLTISAFAANSANYADSIIIGSATFSSGQDQVSVPVYFVTHGDITHYNLPLRIESSGDIRFLGYEIGQALQGWDDNWQGLSLSGIEASQMGFSDLGGEDNPPLNTGGRRVEVLTLNFSIIENPTVREATINSRVDERTGSPLFGLSDGATEVTPVVVSGRITFSPTTAAQESQLPTNVSLSQNYPNPFNPTTEISYALPDSRPVKLTVFNLLGQEVRKLETGIQDAGYHKVIWDGRNSVGQQAPSGTYFYKLDTGDFSQTMKMVMLK